MIVDNRRIEKWAADLACEVSGANRVECRDVPGLGVQMRDFDLVFDEHDEPLEITIHADKSSLEARSRFARVGHEVAGSVSRVWYIAAPYLQVGPDGEARPFDVRQCEQLLPPIIERLEQAGLTEFEEWDLIYDPTHSQDGRTLAALGLRIGTSYEPTDPGDRPRIVLAPGTGGALHPDEVTRAVECEAKRDDNIAKLSARFDAPRRHLFVVLTSASDDDAWWSLVEILEGRLALPSTPRLPAAVTTVWAATLDGGVVVTPPGQWEVFRPSLELRARYSRTH